MTEWKVIDKTNGRYSVSSDGRVRNNVTKKLLKGSGNAYAITMNVKGTWKKRSIAVSKLLERYYGVEREVDRGSKAIIGIDDEGQTLSFDSIYQASKNGFNGGGIMRSLKTGGKHKGFKWSYREEVRS